MLSQIKFKHRLMLFPVMTLVCMLVLLFMIEALLNQHRNDIQLALDSYMPRLRQSRNMTYALDQANEQWRQMVMAEDLSPFWDQTAVGTPMMKELDKVRDTELWSGAHIDSLEHVFLKQFDKNKQMALQAGQGWEPRVRLARLRPFQDLRRATLQMEISELENVQWAFKSAHAALNDMRRVMVFTSLVLAAFFAYGSYKLRESVTSHLRQLVVLVREVEQGNLTVKVPFRKADDIIGDLFNSFEHMVTSLRKLTQQVKGGALALASSAEQISASVADIASAASLTADAATETNTTVEEVRHTALDSNRKAMQVSESAQNTVQISQAGEVAVREAVDGMHHVDNQMKTIAASMKVLDEHSLAISEIIQTVEDVAEQSRLLAVNASIEAVKAGEHGKGFAVVAQEVRALADESKLATTRVRTLLDDIQQAASQAVMQTEMGAQAVESGMHQSVGAGEAIQRLSDAVAEAAQATLQISVSSKEQLVGMDQMVQAMHSISMASNQNVAATQQVESAAQDLKKLGIELTQTLEQYQV